MPQSITVLVVEDEPIIRMDITGDLEDLGFIVLEAANSDEAMSILAINAEIQILFTDVDMPGDMDGLALAAAVRDRWPPIKIIVTSGLRQVVKDDMPADSRFFDKPYRAADIAVAVHELVS